MGLINLFAGRKGEPLRIPRGLETGFEWMESDWDYAGSLGASWKFLGGVKKLAKNLESQGMTLKDIRPLADHYLNRLLAEEEEIYQKYHKPNEEFYLCGSTIAGTVLSYMEILGYPIDEAHRRNPRITKARFEDLKSRIALGFDVHSTEDSFDDIYKIVRDSGKKIIGPEMVYNPQDRGYFSVMEEIPSDSISAIRVCPPPKSGKEEGIFIAPHKGRWNLFESGFMPLRLNERTQPWAVKTYNHLRRYTDFFEKQGE